MTLASELRIVELPSDIEWYEIAGQSIFPVYGSSGGLTPKYVAYLVKRGDGQSGFDGDMGLKGKTHSNGWKTFCVEINTLAEPEVRMKKLNDAVIEASNYFNSTDAS
jgi:hypothetical protein